MLHFLLLLASEIFFFFWKVERNIKIFVLYKNLKLGGRVGWQAVPIDLDNL